jgi:hypothetical protein
VLNPAVTAPTALGATSTYLLTVSDGEDTAVATKYLTIEAVDTDNPLTADLPYQEVVSGVQATLSGTVTGGTGNYTFEWRYNSGATLDLSSTTELNPTFTEVLEPGRSRAIYALTISDGIDTISRTKEIVVLTGTGIDTIPPVITLVGGVTYIPVGDGYVEPGFTAIDSNDGDLSSSVVVTNNIDINTIGPYFVTYTVSDAAGNEAVVIRSVFVVDLLSSAFGFYVPIVDITSRTRKWEVTKDPEDKDRFPVTFQNWLLEDSLASVSFASIGEAGLVIESTEVSGSVGSAVFSSGNEGDFFIDVTGESSSGRIINRKVKLRIKQQ